MHGIVSDGVSLADAIGVAPFGDDKIVGPHAARIGDGEWEALDRMTDRPPHLDDGEAALEKFIRLVRQQVAHPLGRRPFGIIVMHARHHLADLVLLAQLVVGRAQRVVEYDDALGAALRLHQRFYLRVVDVLNLIIVKEIDDLGIVRHEAEAVAVEYEVLVPSVMDRDLVRIGRAARANIRSAGIGRDSKNLAAIVDDIVECCFDVVDGFRSDLLLRDVDHEKTPSRLNAIYLKRNIRECDDRDRVTARSVK